jgi:hypothetical protein
MLVLVAIVTALLGLDVQGASATHTVEHRFETPGGFAVTWDDGSPDACTGTDTDTPPPVGEDYTLVYPSPPALGALGDHPVVVFGAGTNIEYTDAASQRNSNCNPSYRHFLRQLASWGFVVIAYNDGQVGSGQEMLQAADLAILLDAWNTPGNPFFDNLDTTSIATMGHSQGAVGAINAVRSRPGFFESVVTLAMPDEGDLLTYNGGCLFLPSCVQVPIPPGGATDTLGVPIFFARASGLYLPTGHRCEDDDWISDDTEDDWYPETAPFLAATAHVSLPAPADIALCDLAFPSATYPHIWTNDTAGYVTAWLAYTLQNQTQARPAFVGTNPEIASNPDWEGVDRRGLT